MPHRLWRGDQLALLERRRMSEAELAALLETLMQAERTGAHAIGSFLGRASPGVRPRLMQVQRIVSRNIAALACILRRLGREPAPWAGRVGDAPVTPQSLRARLELLGRGQAWVAQRIESDLPRIADRAIRDTLGVVRESHLLGIGICRGIAADLRRERQASNNLGAIDA